MVTAVIDTNVLISALLGHGKPRRLVTKLLQGHTLVSSMQMLAELEDVLSREKFQEVRNAQAIEFLSILLTKTLHITVKQPPRIVTEDPDDDLVLATTDQGAADYIITGDKHLLTLRKFKGIKIVTVNEMLEILRSEPV